MPLKIIFSIKIEISMSGRQGAVIQAFKHVKKTLAQERDSNQSLSIGQALLSSSVKH
jgi:hypothetical protein